MTEIKVEPCSGSSYQVVKYQIFNDEITTRTVLFQGSLADCEAYIRLNEKGYM